MSASLSDLSASDSRMEDVSAPSSPPAVQVDITLSVCAQLRAKSAPGDSLPDRALRGAQSNEPSSGGCLIGQPGPVSPDHPGSGAALDGRSLSSVSLALHSSLTLPPAIR